MTLFDPKVNAALDKMERKLYLLEESCSHFYKLHDGSYERALDHAGYYTLLDAYNQARLDASAARLTNPPTL